MSKPGRKRKIGAKRTASDRISRAAASYQENAGPIATRMRHFGLSEGDARDQKAATFVGRLQLTKVISQQQYDAAQQFVTVREAYQRAIKVPEALRTSSGGGDQGESDSYAAWCRNAIAKYDAARNAVSIDQSLHANRGANLFAAIDHLVIRDQQFSHMVGDLRLALNALAHHFGLMGKGPRASLDRRSTIAA